MAKTRRQKEVTRQRASARKRAEFHGTGFQNTILKRPDNCAFFSVKEEGNRRVDILEYEIPEKGAAGPNPFAEPKEGFYERTFWTHPKMGADGKTYVCPRKTAGKRCPICDHLDKLQKTSDADPDVIKALLPKERQLFNVYDRDEPSKGVQLWEVSYHNFGKQLDSAIKHSDEDEGHDSFWYSDDSGWTLRIGFEKANFAGTSFFKAATVGFKKRETPIPEEIISGAHQLDDLLIVLPYDELNAIFLMDEDCNNEDLTTNDAPEPTPKSRKKKTSSKTASSLEITKGSEVYYEEELCTVLKVTDDTLLKLVGEDEVYVDINVSEVSLGKSEAEEVEETTKTPTKKKKNVKKDKSDGDKSSVTVPSDNDDWNDEGENWDKNWD